MTQTSYSHKEIEQFLQDFAIEKRQVQDLKTQLEERTLECQQLQQQVVKVNTTVNAKDTQKLTQLLDLFKQSNFTTSQTLEDETSCPTNLSTDQLSLPLDTRLKEEIANLQLAYLSEQQHAEGLSYQLIKMKELFLNTQQQLESKNLADGEREREAKALRELNSLQTKEMLTADKKIKEAEEERRKLNEQFESLKQRINHLTEHLSETMKEHNGALDKLKSFSHRQNKWEEQVDNLRQELAQKEQVQIGLTSKLIQLQELERIIEEDRENRSRDKQKIEKLINQINEKDQRLTGLQHLESSLKKIQEQKQGIENKFEEAQNLYKKFEEELKENQQHSKQLERVIYFLRERAEEARLEAKQFEDVFEKSQEESERLTQQLIRTQEELAKTKLDLQTEKLEKEEGQEEIQNLQSQFFDLKENLQHKQQTLQKLESTLTLAQEQVKTKDEQTIQLTAVLSEKNNIIELFEKEIVLIKQSLMRGIREAKEIEAKYIEIVKEKTSLLSKHHHAQNQIDKQQQHLEQSQVHLKQVCLEHQETCHQLQALKEQLEVEENKKEQNQLEIKDKEEELEALCQQLAKLRYEFESLQIELANARYMVQDRESELKQAENYCAKKVKEAALSEDQLEEQKKTIQELQQILTQNKVRIAELQTLTDSQEQQKKQLNEHLQETIKTAETHEAKWEEKYFITFEKWQQAESRVKELEKIEEKQKHLQSILANLGNFFEYMPSLNNSEIASKKEEISSINKQAVNAWTSSFKESAQEEAEKASLEAKDNAPNLFNLPKTSLSLRTNFLE